MDGKVTRYRGKSREKVGKVGRERVKDGNDRRERGENGERQGKAKRKRGKVGRETDGKLEMS